ncbi:MAG: NAD(P)/FAD-dependent oxidoreductase [Candidatus Binatus sp.]|uniref:flavin-containing monooxygenase n=1 Tax=Candidatus Binatus sp. TaxID=2811406 RepID=UPI003C78287E
MAEPLEKPIGVTAKPTRPQEFYDSVKRKFAEERDLRLNYRPDGTAQYTSELTGELSKYEVDPYAGEIKPREPINDTVEVLFIGGGFSALLTSARLREHGVESIRIVERGADVGGTWYWNRYPGVACDVVAYDYLPLLDELDYVPKDHYAKGPEIFAHCQAIARKYNLYELATFQTTVTSTVWDPVGQMWNLTTDRGDRMKARFVICANGTLSKPKLAKIKGLETFKGHSFHTSRWDYAYTNPDLSGLEDKVVGIIGTGATAVQAIPGLGAAAKELYVFQRTPSSIDVRDDWPTDPNWARKLKPGWQTKRRERAKMQPFMTQEQKAKYAAMSAGEKVRRQENANIEAMMKIHQRIDAIVKDKATADALKPWYMLLCKRPCFHNDYLPTFNRPNVHLVDTKGKGITEINEKGPVFEGRQYELDVLIYATGFEVQKTGIYNQIKGENGIELNDKYREGIRTLLGIHSQGYPNLFIMGGYQASFQFNLTDMLQAQGDHIAACIDYARSNGFRSIDVTREAEEWWVQEVIEHRGKTSRNQECTPGYYNFEGEFQRRQDGNYNGGFFQYCSHMGEVQKRMDEHFVFSRK